MARRTREVLTHWFICKDCQEIEEGGIGEKELKCKYCNKSMELFGDMWTTKEEENKCECGCDETQCKDTKQGNKAG